MSSLCNITELNTHSGIFYDKESEIKYYSSNWQFITYLDISSLNNKFQFVKAHYYRTNDLCEEINSKSKKFPCQQTLLFLDSKIRTLYQKETSLKDLIGHGRVKRNGWFNIIGSGLKLLFGTLDSDDAEYYDNAINKVSQDDKSMMLLLKDQVQVVKTTITNFNTSISQIKKSEAQLNENIKEYNKFAENMIDDTYEIKVVEELLNHLTLLTYVSNELDENYDNIINAILFAQQNSIHPAIITPKRIYEELIKAKLNLPTGKYFPIEIKESEIHHLLRITTLKVYYKNSKIVFLMYIPLVDELTFNLYHLIPLPIKHDDKTFVFIQPSSKYLAISTNKAQFSQLNNLNDCKEISSKHLVCKIDKPISNTFSNPICETTLLNYAKSIPKDCNTKMVLGKVEIINKLKQENKWIYALIN